MIKTIIHAIVLAAIFLFTWFLFAQIDWLNLFHLQNVSGQTEKKLGELIWDATVNDQEEIDDKLICSSIDTLVSHICNANQINRENIKIHILKNEEINAFALPDGHLIVYSGLISACENETELTGVISHEIAHIELHHVMKKLIKEIGLSVLISMTTGNGGPDAIQNAAKIVSSTAFDRNLEKAADLKAAEYMLNAELNPEHFANFLYKLSDSETAPVNYLSWLSTHPDSKERASYIIEHCKNKKPESNTLLTPVTWDKLKSKLDTSVE